MILAKQKHLLIDLKETMHYENLLRYLRDRDYF